MKGQQQQQQRQSAAISMPCREAPETTTEVGLAETLVVSIPVPWLVVAGASVMYGPLVAKTLVDTRARPVDPAFRRREVGVGSSGF